MEGVKTETVKSFWHFVNTQNTGIFGGDRLFAINTLQAEYQLVFLSYLMMVVIYGLVLHKLLSSETFYEPITTAGGSRKYTYSYFHSVRLDYTGDAAYMAYPQ